MKTHSYGRGLSCRGLRDLAFYLPVSQSWCAVAKRENFWRATGQSNLADRMEDFFTGQNAAEWRRKPNFGIFGCGQPFECQIWLSIVSLLVTAHDCDTRSLSISFLEPAHFLRRMLDEYEGLWKGPVLIAYLLYNCIASQITNQDVLSRAFFFVEHAP